MKNIGHSIQQSVGLLAEILGSRTQPNFYSYSSMLPSPWRLNYQDKQVQNGTKTL